MPTRLLLLLVFFALFSPCAQAQVYQPGLLVRSNGDTLRGEIENNFWADPPKFIRFRPTPTAAAQLLRPRQLRAVLFAGGRYFRFEALPIDHAAETRLDRLPQGYHPDVRQDSLLAEVLLQGPASLLRVVRLGATHYLVRRSGQPILALSERKYLSPTPTGKPVITDGNNYRAQLGLYFGDCPAAGRAAQKAPFTPEGLAAVLQAYHASCAPTHPPARSWLAAATPATGIPFQYGVLAGGRYLNIANNNNIAQQGSPFVGVYGEVFLPNRVMSVFGDLSLSLFKGKGTTVAYLREVPGMMNGNPVIFSDPVYSSFSYRSGLASARLGLRFHFRPHREQRWYAGFSLEANRVFAPSFTITDGPPAELHMQDLQGTTVPIIPGLGVGWRSQRVTVSLDGLAFGPAVCALRLGVAYRLSRNPDAPKPARLR